MCGFCLFRYRKQRTAVRARPMKKPAMQPPITAPTDTPATSTLRGNAFDVMSAKFINKRVIFSHDTSRIYLVFIGLYQIFIDVTYHFLSNPQDNPVSPC